MLERRITYKKTFGSWSQNHRKLLNFQLHKKRQRFMQQFKAKLMQGQVPTQCQLCSVAFCSFPRHPWINFKMLSHQ